MRLAIVILLVAACARSPTPASSRADAIDAAVRRGSAFLTSRQSSDGAFRSTAYSALRDGWSLTPLSALALRMAPRTPTIEDAYRRAVDFTATVVVDDAPRGASEVSYPLYAYALGAIVLGASDNRRHRAAHSVLIAALRGLQMTERNGWHSSDASHGGWGYARDAPRRPDGAIVDDLLTANLSATLLAASALALSGVAVDDPALAAARGFVHRCQSADGGFFFSPALADGNKAGALDGNYRPYGSMTADGLRALLRLGGGPGDARVASATRWLDRAFDAARNPGDFPSVAEVRRASSYYYWAWSAAHAARHLDKREWAEALADELLRRQLPDGSWVNDATEMREDDPLVATPFAIAALVIARSVISGERPSHAY